MRRPLGIIIALLLLVLAAVPALGQASIVEAVAEQEELSTLVAAVEAADPGVLDTLVAEGPYTLFAPTNQAFANLAGFLDVSLEELLEETDLLSTILYYHIGQGRAEAADLLQLDGGTLPTVLDGSFIGISVLGEDGDEEVVLNDVVEVIEADIGAGNGVVHVINDVLLPQVVIDSLQDDTLGFQDEPTMFDETRQPMTAVRGAHFSPDTPPVDVYVDGEVAISELEFGDVSAFFTVPNGDYEIALAPAGTSIEEAAIGPFLVTLPAEEFLTITALGSLEGGTLFGALLEQDFNRPQPDTALVTVLHTIEGLEPVDLLTTGGELLASDLAFPEALINDIGYVENVYDITVEAGTYDVQVVPGDQVAPALLTLEGLTLEPLTYYLVAAVGTAENPEFVFSAIDEERIAALRETIDPPIMGEMEEIEVTEEPAAETAMVPGETILALASERGDLETFYTAVQSVTVEAIADRLSAPGPYTVFAPTDDAFANLISSIDLTVDELLSEQELLTEILRYHIVEGEFAAEDVTGLDGESVQTLLGPDNQVGISVSDGTVTLNNTATVVETDIQAANGVIHLIDQVLLPQSALDALGLSN